MGTEIVREAAPAIYGAIAGVMKDIAAVGKDKEFKSKYGGYKFRGIDDVMNALHPAMVKNKVFVVPVILEQTRESRTAQSGNIMVVSICKIRYEFYGEDGSCVSAIVIGEGMDTGDKATNKAMSIAFKYACFQVFCIPTEEMADPDGERPEMEEGKNDSPKRKAEPRKDQKTDRQGKQEDMEGKGISPDLAKITPAMLNTIQSEIKRTGVSELQIASNYNVKKIEELTVVQFDKVMKRFQATPDKEGKHE